MGLVDSPHSSHDHHDCPWGIYLLEKRITGHSITICLALLLYQEPNEPKRKWDDTGMLFYFSLDIHATALGFLGLENERMIIFTSGNPHLADKCRTWYDIRESNQHTP